MVCVGGCRAVGCCLDCGGSGAGCGGDDRGGDAMKVNLYDDGEITLTPECQADVDELMSHDDAAYHSVLRGADDPKCDPDNPHCFVLKPQ